MTDSTATPPPAPPRTNPAQRLGGVLFSPDLTFRDIAARPDWVVPLIVIVVLALVSTFVVAPRLDLETSMREQFAERGMKEAEIDEAMETMAKIQKYTLPLTALAVPLTLLVIAGVLLLVFKLFGGAGGFKQSWSVTLYSWVPQIVKSIIATLLIVRAGTVTLEEFQTLLKSHPGFLADPHESPAAFALLSSLDVFNIWTAALLALGFARAHKFSFSKSVAIVLFCWAVFVLGRVGIAALQGMGAAG